MFFGRALGGAFGTFGGFNSRQSVGGGVPGKGRVGVESLLCKRIRGFGD